MANPHPGALNWPVSDCLWRDNLDEERATITMRIWCRDFLMIAVFLAARKVDFLIVAERQSGPVFALVAYFGGRPGPGFLSMAWRRL